MDVLPVHFRTLQFFGIWSETGKDRFLVKYIWRPFNIISTMIFTISQLSALSIYRNNVADFTDCLFLSMMYLGLCIKLVNWLVRYDVMVDLLDEFRKKEYLPRNKQERVMMGKYNKISMLIYKGYMLSGLSSGMLVCLMPLISMALGTSEIFLPVKTYEFIDKNDLKLYWLTYAFQVYADFIGIFINITFDMIFVSLLLFTYGQIDLCCHRFMSSGNDVVQKSIKECVAHQLLIRRIVRKVEFFFMPVVVPQIILSLIIFCTSVYNLAQTDIGGVQALSLLVYIVSLLGQLCCYCWFGNELKVKSNAIRKTIYNSNWVTLKAKDQKSLYFLMLCCDQEITLSFQGFCVIDMEVFVWVLKASYSAYNLLKTVE